MLAPAAKHRPLVLTGRYSPCFQDLMGDMWGDRVSTTSGLDTLREARCLRGGLVSLGGESWVISGVISGV